MVVNYSILLNDFSFVWFCSIHYYLFFSPLNAVLTMFFQIQLLQVYKNNIFWAETSLKPFKIASSVLLSLSIEYCSITNKDYFKCASCTQKLHRELVTLPHPINYFMRFGLMVNTIGCQLGLLSSIYEYLG